LLKAYPLMVYFTHLHKILNLLVIVTMIGLEVMKTEKVLLVVFYLGEVAFTLSSKKQSILALSICEAEYVVAVWLSKLLEEVQQKQKKATKIFVDNKSAIALAKNAV